MEDWRKIIKKDMNLKNLNTLRISSVVEFYAKPKEISQLINLIKWAEEKNLKIFILGNGSNIVFAKDYYKNFLIIDMKGFCKIKIKENDKIEVYAGALSKDIIRFSIVNELTGCEFLAGIPGTLGGMVCMNAGAFGYSISSIIDNVKCLNLENFKIENCDNLKFFYRGVEGLENKIILSGILRLKKGKREKIKEKIREFILKRKKSQPKGFSAGSIFKNPEGDYAGRLIEASGLKGYRKNFVKISEKHANFIINEGEAKGKDVVEIIEKVKNEVFRKKGVKLEQEVIIVS